MKGSRLLITILCATTAIAVLIIFWQARTIRTLHREQAALRWDLRSALAAGLENSSASAMNSPEAQRLELIKLRHENRELRESLAKARSAQPTGVKEIIRSVLPSSASPVRVRPEWLHMQSHLSNIHARALSEVNNGTNEFVRFLSLNTAAKASLGMGRTEEARGFAEEAMLLREKYSGRAPQKANGEIVHDANLVLGRIAADEGRLEDAKQHLLAAGQATSGPVLSSFGPNMGLAKDLLERGKQATVLQYFELCRKFWSDTDKLDLWKKDVEAGRIPDFGSNLNY